MKATSRIKHPANGSHWKKERHVCAKALDSQGSEPPVLEAGPSGTVSPNQPVEEKIELEADLKEVDIKIQALQKSIVQSVEWERSLLVKKENLTIVMPFDGLITSTTSGLMGSFFTKGETILELREGSLQIVNVLVPDHDRELIKVGDSASNRIYRQ